MKVSVESEVPLAGQCFVCMGDERGKWSVRSCALYSICVNRADDALIEVEFSGDDIRLFMADEVYSTRKEASEVCRKKNLRRTNGY